MCLSKISRNKLEIGKLQKEADRLQNEEGVRRAIVQGGVRINLNGCEPRFALWYVYAWIATKSAFTDWDLKDETNHRTADTTKRILPWAEKLWGEREQIDMETDAGEGTS